MLSFIKKLFAKKSAPAAPYKVEAPVTTAKKPAAKKPAVKKPTARKPKTTKS